MPLYVCSYIACKIQFFIIHLPTIGSKYLCGEEERRDSEMPH